MTLAGPLLIALCMVVRATDVFFRSSVLETTDTLSLVTWEHLIGALILAPFVSRLPDLLKAGWKFVLAILCIGSFVSLGGILCFSAAFRYLNPAVVILLQKLQPVVTILLANLLLGERPKKSFYPLAVLAILSGYVLSFGFVPPADLLSTFTNGATVGVGLALLSVLFWGSGTVLGRYILTASQKTLTTQHLTVFRYVIGALTGSLLLLSVRGIDGYIAIIALPSSTVLKIIYIALGPGVLALWLFYRGLKTTTATLASMLELIFPLASTAIVWIFLSKPLSQIQITAALVLFASVTLLTYLQKKESQ